MLPDLIKVKRKSRKKVFDYLKSKYGIERATIYLNSFFEENWKSIPGDDILSALKILNTESQTDSKKEMSDKVDTMLATINIIINDLKYLKKNI